MEKKWMGRMMLVVLGLLAVCPATHAQVVNLALNPSFEEDEVILDDPAWQSWATWGYEGGLQSKVRIDDTEAVDGSRSLRIEPKGGTDWYFIVLDLPMPVKSGTRYTASFWVKAEKPRSLGVQMKATDNTSGTWGFTTFQVTTEWAEYHFTTAPQYREIKLEFFCAASDVPFWLDFVYVYEGEYVPGIDPSGASNPGKAVQPTPKDGAVIQPTQAVLQWRAGKFAQLHDVYFGESLDEVRAATRDTAKVFVGRQPVALLSVGTAGGPSPTGLVPGRTYYWRVDEVNDANFESPWKGDIWSFTVQPLTAWKPYPANGMKNVDPNQVLNWQKGTGAVFHTVYFGQSADTVNNAVTGGYMVVNPPYSPGALKPNTTYYWRVDEFTPPTPRKGELWSFTTRGTEGGVKAQYFKGKDLSGTAVLTQTESSIDHNWSGDVAPGLADNVSARWTANLEVPFSETYTFTTTTDDGVRLWLDGKLIIDNWTDHTSTDNAAKVNLVAGQVYSLRMEWYDNTGPAVARLFWESPSQPRQIVPQGWLQLPLRAAGPSPANGSPSADQASILSWIAGDQAKNHDVYFGEDAKAVADADPKTAGVYRGRQAADATTFDPGPLVWGKTYYWRVDEIDTANAASPWKGVVWSFTAANFLVVEDFESYNDDLDAKTTIFDTWVDGYTNKTGATVGNGQAPFAERRIVNSGSQSMPFDYNNVNSPFYSETSRTWSKTQDWTVSGVDTLTLYFRGRTNNGLEKLYVALQDSTNKVAVVVHPSSAAPRASQWIAWNIPLKDFAGVNPAKIKTLFIGLGDRTNPKKGGAGRIYIDDIRITKSKP